MDYSLPGGILLGLALGITPGPVVTEIIRRGTAGGLRPALGVAAGAAAGNSLAAGAAAAGTGALTTLPGVPAALTVAGAAWIAFLAIDTWRQASRIREAGESALKPPASPLPSWLAGILVVVTNPVVWAFWLAVLATSSGGSTAAARLAFAAGFVAGITLSDASLAVVSARGGRHLGPRGQAWALRACAVLLLGFALHSLARLL